MAAGNRRLPNTGSMNSINYSLNLLLLSLFVLVVPFISNGQLNDKKKTVELLCHTWESDFTKSPQKLDCFPPDACTSIRFITSGYIIFNEKKGSEGVWNYDATRRNLYIIVYGNLWKYKVSSLTETELAVESTNDKKTTVYYLRRNSP
ncbi:MAG: hypothetical protein ABUT20_59365 [Bacteroidota bacterium]